LEGSGGSGVGKYGAEPERKLLLDTALESSESELLPWLPSSVAESCCLFNRSMSVPEMGVVWTSRCAY
jgi:hypothetical protein